MIAVGDGREGLIELIIAEILVVMDASVGMEALKLHKTHRCSRPVSSHKRGELTGSGDRSGRRTGATD